MKKKLWDFVYDEKVFDLDTNYIGVISNGNDLLFYHAYKAREEDEFCTCFIFSSLVAMTTCMPAEVSYLWTPENDSKLLDFLDNAGDNFCGGGRGIHAIEF